MKEQGLQHAVDTLATRLGRSVAINDPAVRVICASRHFGDEDSVRVRAVLQRGAGATVIGHILSQGVAGWTEPGLIPPKDDIGMKQRLCMPIRWRGELLGLLMIIDPDGSMEGEQLALIKTASVEIAAFMFGEFLADDEQRRSREAALADLLSVRLARRQFGQQVLAEDRWLRAGRHVTVSVGEVVEAPRGLDGEQVEMVLRAVLENVTHAWSGIDGFLARGRRLVIVQLDSTEPAEDRLRRDAARIADQVYKFLGSSSRCVFGIGSPVTGLTDAWLSHDQARIAARAAALLPSEDRIMQWSELGAYGVLLRIPTEELSVSVLPPPLRALLSRDPHGGLLETLTAYLDHAGSSPKTAAALHIHRTSLYYRLHQIEEITGLDLDNGDHRLVLHLGVKLAALLSAQEFDDS
ncbi:PucR family transcriptional regulator [Pseudonocardia spinosispora]|uniref:PucR family transcriptional regulator n=1 Tax=Pseudonocardia spinosispora TaxID=103441 RepID=UPI0004113A79|nr:helix-turn-helix domain-containing protein [Pseudonocardia spinosispora]